MANDDVCVGCRKKGKLSRQTNKWVCTNKKCDFGRNHNKNEWDDPNLKFDRWDLLWQGGWWAPIMLIILGIYQITDTFASILIGPIILIFTILFGFMGAADDSNHWERQKKFFWYITKPLGLLK